MVRCLKFSAWAVGLLAASAIMTGEAAAQVSVSIQNQQSRTIYVAFTLGNGQAPGAINWGNCSGFVSNNQVAIPSGMACNTSVPTSSGSSRFCASSAPMSPPNCYQAQTRHQTMIETTFGAGAAGCYPTSQASCVWYDISLIPSNCTDPLWQTQNYCSNTGGAAYNLPVQLSCQNQPTYTCKGPPGTVYGNSGFPTNCGNPNATCTGNTPNCVNAYFHPMFVPPWSQYQPNAQCLAGSTLRVTFLAGP
ncbi:hypothetical protein [Reyranella soli]|uniref:Uncharacterized protein n=1 Tax=Reyranella soli TaxID=1230389 RepID=A0A512NMJ9_9HYPH|nr:hypothetical protein [Reyranella soli]GEP60171.1 hypothetical protein RSO01_73370 [Reyranella soli]